MKRMWLVALVAATGCVDLKSSYPDRKLYTLAAERPGAAAAPAKESVLRVRRFTASKLSEGSELVTRTAEAVYESDFYNAFFVPPAMQLTEQTQRWLGASGLFSAVVGTGSTLPETHVLEGNLVALHADRRGAAAAVMEIQFMLVRVSSEPTAVLFQKNYREAVALSEDGPDAVVRGWNGALGRVLAGLEADLAKTPRK
ncbi:MAG: membrane integrity-associated transporter subunit PqiC [Planctomycetes bacterium]|nr:membrane integrity-associated transporter subunit PqiC [Planctomycetota bacterium]